MNKKFIFGLLLSVFCSLAAASEVSTWSITDDNNNSTPPIGQRMIAASMTSRPDIAPQLANALLQFSPAIGASGAAVAPALLK